MPSDHETVMSVTEIGPTDIRQSSGRVAAYRRICTEKSRMPSRNHARSRACRARRKMLEQRIIEAETGASKEASRTRNDRRRRKAVVLSLNPGRSVPGETREERTMCEEGASSARRDKRRRRAATHLRARRCKPSLRARGAQRGGASSCAGYKTGVRTVPSLQSARLVWSERNRYRRWQHRKTTRVIASENSRYGPSGAPLYPGGAAGLRFGNTKPYSLETTGRGELRAR
jgi:hypothetical protein